MLVLTICMSYMCEWARAHKHSKGTALSIVICVFDADFHTKWQYRWYCVDKLLFFFIRLLVEPMTMQIGSSFLMFLEDREYIKYGTRVNLLQQ
jgi:hypothetical protein